MLMTKELSVSVAFLGPVIIYHLEAGREDFLEYHGISENNKYRGSLNKQIIITLV